MWLFVRLINIVFIVNKLDVLTFVSIDSQVSWQMHQERIL